MCCLVHIVIKLVQFLFTTKSLWCRNKDPFIYTLTPIHIYSSQNISHYKNKIGALCGNDVELYSLSLPRNFFKL